MFLAIAAVLPPSFVFAAVADPRAALPSDASPPERRPDGEFRLNAPMQDLVADVGRDGVDVSSVDDGGTARFALRVERLDRERGKATRLSRARVESSKTLVRVDRGALVEELSATPLGIRQDFVVAKRPRGDGSLRLTLALAGARAARLDARTVGLTLDDARELHYSALHVSDANGRVLPAGFRVDEDHRIAIVVDDRDAAYPVRIDPTLTDASWAALAVPATSGEVHAMATGGSDLYIGGTFTTMGLDVPVLRVAKWNGSTWSALGAGVPSGTVRALTWHAATSRLVIAGTFGIQVWDGTTHASPGLFPEIFSLASHGNEMYAGAFGGVITSTDGGANWTQLGAQFDGLVSALVVDPGTGTLYASGMFGNVGVPAANVARWNGTAWAPLGAGLVGDVICLAWDDAQDRLFASGFFTDGGAPNRVFAWNGTSWSETGGGFEAIGRIHAIAYDPVQKQIVVGGTQLAPAGSVGFSSALVLKDGTTPWVETDLQPNHLVRALLFDPATQAVVAGGRISSGGLDSPSADNVVSFATGSWRALPTFGTDGTVRKVLRDAARNRLYAGGSFSRIAGVDAFGVAMFDGTRWSALGRGLGSGVVNDLALDPATGDVYAAGDFITDDGVFGVARWNGTSWSGLGTGLQGGAGEAIAYDEANDFLFVGGFFFAAGGVADTSFLARWDGNAWTAVGSGVDFNVRALAMDQANVRLYVGGRFDNAGGAAHSKIASFKGFSWSPVAKGISGLEVSALAIDPAAGVLYVGGDFDGAVQTNDAIVAASNVAAYNIAANTWSPLAGGVNNRVLALAHDPVQGLVAGGPFTRAQNSILQVVANGVAQFSGGTWFALGSGVTGTGVRVRTLAWDSTQQRIYVGGDISAAGGKPAVLAFADYKLVQAITLGAPPPPTLGAGLTVTLSPATGGASGNPVVFGSLRPASCSVTGMAVTTRSWGLCAIGADQAGNATYASAPQETISIAVDRFGDGFE